MGQHDAHHRDRARTTRRDRAEHRHGDPRASRAPRADRAAARGGSNARAVARARTRARAGARAHARGSRADVIGGAGGSAELARLLGVAQSQLTDGKLADALATAKLAKSRGELRGAWWLVIGDASRGLGHADDAAEAFDRAARDLTGAERAEAGYSAAYVRFHDLGEPVIALTSLIVSRADDEGSVLEERALGLHAQILDTLGRKREAHDIAKRYLARFPESDLGAYMHSLAK